MPKKSRRGVQVDPPPPVIPSRVKKCQILLLLMFNNQRKIFRSQNRALLSQSAVLVVKRVGVGLAGGVMAE